MNAVVTKEKRSWSVQVGEVHDTLSRKSGVLEEMSVQGAEQRYALQLTSVVPLSEAGDADTERHRCLQTTNEALARHLTTVLLSQTYAETMPLTLASVSTLDEAERSMAARRQVDFWVFHHQNDMADWVRGRSQVDGWTQQILSQIGSTETYESFLAQIPENARAGALPAYQQAWKEELLIGLSREYTAALEAMVMQALAGQVSTDDPTVIPQMISTPIAEAVAEVAPDILNEQIATLVAKGVAPLAKP
ncbi:MAG: hypothetical protein AAFV53_03510 [Myxococcota bacterium]